MTKLMSGAEVEIYYIILFAEKVEGCFFMVLCRRMLRKSQSSHVIFSFLFLFVCALDMHWYRIIPRGKPELILENHHFTRWECGNMCQNKKKKRRKKRIRLNVSCTRTPLSLFRFGWVHLTSRKRGTWVKQKIGQWPWGCEPVMTRAQLMSILSDFLHSSWARGIIFGEICIMEP